MLRVSFGTAALALALCLPSIPAAAATHKGRNVDGHRYHGSVLNNDYGSYDDTEIQFRGDHAYVYFPSGGRLVLFLEDEEIVDPHSIFAHDPRRGITWEIDVKDMNAR